MADTTVGVSKPVRDELRQVQREVSAAQRLDLTINDVIKHLIELYRQQSRTRR